MCINISEHTAALVEEYFNLDEREPRHVKGIGEIKMWYVDKRR